MTNKNSTIWLAQSTIIAVCGLLGIGICVFGAIHVYVRDLAVADKIEVLKQTKTALEEEVLRLTEEQQKTSEKLKKSIEEYSVLNAQLSEVGSKFAQVKKILVDMESKVAMGRSEEERLTLSRKTLAEDLESLTHTKTVLAKEIASMREQREALRPAQLKYQSLKQDNDIAERKQTTLQSQVSNLQQKLGDIQTKYSMLQADYSRLQADLSVSKNAMESSGITLREAKKQIKYLSEEEIRLQKENDLLNAQLEVKGQELKTYEVAIEKAVVRLKQAETSQSALNDFNGYMSQLSSLVGKYNADADAIRSVINDLKGLGSQLQDALKDINSGIPVVSQDSQTHRKPILQEQKKDKKESMND